MTEMGWGQYVASRGQGPCSRWLETQMLEICILVLLLPLPRCGRSYLSEPVSWSVNWA